MDKKLKFLDQINNVSNDKLLVLEKLNQSKLPLVIYGTSGYARTLKVFLEQYNLKIDAACVDLQYYDESNSDWFGIPIYTIEDLPKKFASFNVLIGFSKFKVAEKKLDSLLGCNGIFFLDCTLSLNFFNYDFIVKNLDNFFLAYNLLEDEISKKTFTAFINAKISGKSDALYDLYASDQYFPKDIIVLDNNEVFVDCGAYNGDTVQKFISETQGNYNKIYAFEPDKNAFEKLCLFVDKNNICEIVLLNKGVWSKKTELMFNPDPNRGERSLITDNGAVILQTESIDNVLCSNRASFIKMDVEGSELQAIYGVEHTIKNYHPKLAISMYHKPEDLITIPAYLKKIMPQYKFFLRNHLHIAQELVLYAVIM